jgi:hypothetical protein
VELAACIPTENMMSISRSSRLVRKLGQAESLAFGPTLERGSDAQDRLGCEAKHPSDEYWFPGTSKSGLAAFFRNTLLSIKTDPRQLEIEEAERKALVEQLRRTYARVGDAILWSVFAFIFAAAALIPVLGWFAALILAAGLVSVLWIMWDRVRRI